MIGEQLTWGIIIAAAAADSINPCVFGVLIFLMAFMTKVFKNKYRMLLGGLLYTLAVYITYFGLGVGLLSVSSTAGFSVYFYWFAAILALIAGAIEIKDYFWYGKGFSLQIFPLKITNSPLIIEALTLQNVRSVVNSEDLS